MINKIFAGLWFFGLFVVLVIIGVLEDVSKEVEASGTPEKIITSVDGNFVVYYFSHAGQKCFVARPETTQGAAHGLSISCTTGY